MHRTIRKRDVKPIYTTIYRTLRNASFAGGVLKSARFLVVGARNDIARVELEAVLREVNHQRALLGYASVGHEALEQAQQRNLGRDDYLERFTQAAVDIAICRNAA